MFHPRPAWERQHIPSMSISTAGAAVLSVTPVKSFLMTAPAAAAAAQKHQHQIPASLVYFHTYLNIAYYLGLSPFIISYRYSTRSYVIHKSRFQSCICSIIHISILFQFLSQCRGLDVGLLRLDPSNYFEIANVMGNLMYYAILFPTLWGRQAEILDIFNLVTNNFLGSTSNNTHGGTHHHNFGSKSLQAVQTYIRPIVLCTAFLAWAFYSVITGSVAVNKYFILSVQKDYSARANFVYLFQSRNFTGLNVTHAAGIFQVTEHGDPVLFGLTVWFIFVEFYIWFGSYYSELLVLLSSVFVRRIVLDFIHSLRGLDTTAQMALRKYLRLKRIIQQLNRAVGPLVLCVVVSALPYYASNLETIFTAATDGIRRLRISFYCLVFLTTLVVAADGNTRIGEFKDWLLDEGRASSIPQSSLYLVIHELNTCGLRGHGFFTITYHFFGTILSVLMTYSFIVVQFHSTIATPANINATHLTAGQSTH